MTMVGLGMSWHRPAQEYQEFVGERLAEIIVCLHPIFVQLGNDVAWIHR